jgi:coenzyme F420-0:L-glutamate ligase/coenzyme F420-1:gamma-L-glutamate ligase
MEIAPVPGIPMIKRGDNLGRVIGEAIRRSGLRLEDGDVVVVAQKIVSKAEGRIVDLSRVSPSRSAVELAGRLKKDPREVEVILRESKEIVRLGHVLISRTEHGFICANAGADRSNAGPGMMTLLPRDPDRSARRIRRELERTFKRRIAVIISDTWGRPFRMGCVGMAIGVSGMEPLMRLRGERDLHGRMLRTTVLCPADSIAAAAVLVMGESGEGTPVAIVRGARYRPGRGGIGKVVMPPGRDLFR